MFDGRIRSATFATIKHFTRVDGAAFERCRRSSVHLSSWRQAADSSVVIHGKDKRSCPRVIESDTGLDELAGSGLQFSVQTTGSCQQQASSSVLPPRTHREAT